eukprot:3774918-Rhodomonas_salina.1
MASSALSAEKLASLSVDYEASGRLGTDDEASCVTAASWISVNPTLHASTRASERNVNIEDIQRAKAYGCLSLAVHVPENSNVEHAMEEICRWGDRVTQNFQDLSFGKPQMRGPDRRVELELLNSQKVARKVKDFLRYEEYFSSGDQLRRILFITRRGQQDLVVVEGEGRNACVQVITVILRHRQGNNEVELKQGVVEAKCYSLFTDAITPLIESGDFPDKVEQAIKGFEHAHQELNGEWHLGPFSLSSWPPSMPLLQLAAIYGRLSTVERLVQEFRVDINFQRSKKGHTALHLAAYWAQEPTVAWFLQHGADPHLTSLQYGNSRRETALDAVRWVQEQWRRSPWTIRGKKLDVFRVCFSPQQPPQWDGIVDLLQTAMAANGEHKLPPAALKKSAIAEEAVFEADSEAG